MISKAGLGITCAEVICLKMQVTVFSWTFCPFAKKAKQLLTEVGADFKAVELDQLPDGKALKAELGMVRPCAVVVGPHSFFCSG